MNKLTSSELKEWLDYDPSTGIFRWKKKNNRRIVVGAVAGSSQKSGRQKGRVFIHIEKVGYAAHRLAWLYMTGEFPKQTIDHINGDPSDNRIANLRDVPPMVNSQNLKSASCLSSTGLLGACKNTKRNNYFATIKVNKKAIYLGSFDTPLAAHEAYLVAKRKFHKGCTI